MTLVSLKNGSEDGVLTAKLEFSDGSFFTVKACYFGDYCGDFYNWEPGRDISAPEEEALRFAAGCYRAERAGTRLIARAEQRRLVFQAKLERRGFGSACVKTVVSRLLEQGLLDDGRYAESWLRGRLAKRGGKPAGPRKLAAMLQSRGIDRETAAAALQNVLGAEEERNLLERFLAGNSLPAAGFSLRSRLKAEGFSPEVLNRYFDE